MAWVSFGSSHVERSSNGPGVRFARPLTHSATLIAIAGALAPIEQLSGVPYAIAIALGAVLGLLGTWGISIVEQRGSRRLLMHYFALTSALSAAIVVVSGGYATIAVMPILSQAVLFGTIWHGLIGTGALLGLLTWTLHDVMSAERLGSTLLSFGGAIAFVLIFSVVYRREARWRAQSEQLRDQLAESNLKLRLHAEQVEELAATRERNRMARELHDGLGHYLTAIHVQLEAARALLGKSPDGALKGIGRAQLLSRQGLTDVRESVSLLRQGVEESEHKLEDALSSIVTTWSTEEQPVVFETRGDLPKVSETTQHALRRILQEALSNVHHHARGSHTVVTLTSAREHLQLDVQDDGKGGDSESTVAHTTETGLQRGSQRAQWGLQSIQERVSALGGELSLQHSSGSGFHVQVRLPL